jgi:alpha-L-arabinofuranosidase
LRLVLAVWAGLALNGDTTPEEDLQPFIDDALNEIEFVCGPADSPWGKRRAELGHPEPFTLNYVEIGNEDWLAGYPGGWDSYRNYRFPECGRSCAHSQSVKQLHQRHRSTRGMA